jgi:uncharacterized protein (DUF983 family)
MGLVGAAFRGRCPRCGEGRIFTGKGTEVAESCSVCGLPLGRHDIGDGASVFLIFLLGFTLVPALVLGGNAWDWPFWLTMLLAALALGASVPLLLKPSRAMALHLQYRYRPEDYAASKDEDGWETPEE